MKLTDLLHVSGDQVSDLLKGSAGAALIEGVENVPMDNQIEWVKVLIQIVVGLGTLWNMYMNRKKKVSKED